MRLSAYKKAVDEAKALPENIPELRRYFDEDYNPRRLALAFIATKARCDTRGLFDGELLELMQYINK